MSDDSTVTEDTTVDLDTTETTENNDNATNNGQEDPVEALVQERLAKMKSNMDRMARERDEALKKAAELEQKEKAAKIKALEEEGKHKEVAEMRIAELQAQLKMFEEENTRLNRDSVLSGVLSSLEFRNERSREMAYRDIVEQLVQNENGQWLHKSGTTIRDFVESYSKSEDNSFLFRVKTNSGAGTGNTAGTPNMDKPRKLSEMSQDEVLKLAASGKLGKNFSY